jgi:hypothetical protein
MRRLRQSRARPTGIREPERYVFAYVSTPATTKNICLRVIADYVVAVLKTPRIAAPQTSVPIERRKPSNPLAR